MSLWLSRSLVRKKLETMELRRPFQFEIKLEPPPVDSLGEDYGAADATKERESDYRIFLSTKRVCRLCDSPADIISIFKRPDEFDVIGAIHFVTNILVKQDDWYPKYICSMCLRDLRAAYYFKRKCQQTDIKYRLLGGTDHSFSSADFVRHDFKLLLHNMAQRRRAFINTKKKKKVNSQETKISESVPSPTKSPSLSSHHSISPLPVTGDPPVSESTDDGETKTLKEIARSPKRRRMKVKVKKKLKRDKRNAKEMKDRANKRKLMCIKCDAIFPNEDLFKEHRDQSACKRTQCPHCEKQVLNLRIHLRRMHPAGPVFQCDHCDRKYPIMSELQRHMLVHTNRYDFPCDLCSYRGKRKEYLKLHMRSHGAERYLCSECPATFINQSNFNKHRLVHANKQYQCDKCKKAFRYAKQLQIHDEAQHQKIRHPCSMCTQIFKYRSKLLKHELRVHNREKRKLNPTSAATTIRLDAEPEPRHVDAHSNSDLEPLETYLHFKKANADAVFYPRNFDQR